MTATPIVQERRRGGRVESVRVERRIAVRREFIFSRPAAQIFHARIHEPDADMIAGARPAPRAHVKLVCRVIVFVFDLAFINAGGHATHFFSVHHRAVIPVVGGDEFHVSVGIHGHPIENVIIQFHAETRFAHGSGRVICRVRKNRISVNPRIAAPERVTDFNVSDDAAARPAAQRVAAGDALDGNFAAFAAIGFWVNRDARFLLTARGIVGPIGRLPARLRVEHFQICIFE